jgi:putative ABC transport system ATP-binding protein
MPVLEGEHLRRSFGEGALRTTVIRNVSLRLSRGELVLLMGPSGSGKSTLLALLSGLARPDSGTVVALGEEIWKLSESQREQFRLRHCGFIFQGYNLFPSLTAREQLEMTFQWGESGKRGQAAARLRVEEMLQQLSLTDKGDLFPAQLSGGEKQRVAIGRALIKQPTLLFCDEPTAALDWTHGKQVLELLRAQMQRHQAMLFVVSHDSRLIPYADHLFYLDDGCLTDAPPAAPERNKPEVCDPPLPGRVPVWCLPLAREGIAPEVCLHKTADLLDRLRSAGWSVSIALDALLAHKEVQTRGEAEQQLRQLGIDPASLRRHDAEDSNSGLSEAPCLQGPAPE